MLKLRQIEVQTAQGKSLELARTVPLAIVLRYYTIMSLHFRLPNMRTIKIRFRDSELRMRSGELIGEYEQDRNFFIVQNGTTKTYVLKNKVFLDSGLGKPFTPELLYWWSPMRLKMTPKVASFLDGAARILSISTSSGSSYSSRLRSIVSYVNQYVKYDFQVANRTWVEFEDIIINGRGSCLHYSFIVAAILCEGGFRPKLVSYIPADEWGHIWLEVNVPGNLRQTEYYVVDPSGEILVMRFGDVSHSAHSGNFHFARQFYLNPNKKYYEIT